MKNEILSDIDALIASCEEGINGDWDCTAPGFEAMITLLDKVRSFVEDAGDNTPPTFPNDFTSWHETHYEIVAAIETVRGSLDHKDTIVKRIEYSQGTGGLYELAQELTDKFEQENKGAVWGETKEFIDTIEAFIDTYIYSEQPQQWNNLYKCPSCGTLWQDVWTAQCDDQCPSCGKKNISPYQSTEI